MKTPQRKDLIPGLEQSKCKMNLKHGVMPESKEVLTERWHVTGTTKPASKGSTSEIKTNVTPK